MEAASIAHTAHEHHGPPPANRSSRVDPQLLGILLFIISEVMIFGAFFTAYFFIRIVTHNPWPAHNTKLPEAVAGINTAILLSSSLTLHWAQTSIKKGNRFGLKAGMVSTFSETKSGWLRADLIERVRRSTGKPVEHVVHGQSTPTTV